jgi:hypothetical protein
MAGTIANMVRTYMLHGILVRLPRVIREEGLHVLFNKEVV